MVRQCRYKRAAPFGIAAIVLGAGALLLPMTSHADFVSFAGYGSAGADLGSPSTVIGGISITGIGNGGTTTLTQRDTGGERGVGVCSSNNDGTCVNPWFGDKDELDNVGAGGSEKIELMTTSVWGGQFGVSSLDGNEGGVISWFDGSGTSLGSVDFGRKDGLGATGGATIGLFTSGDWAGETYTYLLDLTAVADWDPTAAKVVFMSGGSKGETSGNDYLVAGASVVPIPAAVWLFGSALVGLVGLGRRGIAQAA